MAVVKLDHITKHYGGGGAPAVDDISLTIEDGEFMVLLGPSGCGKSTTLRMVAGLESITAGTLSIDDVVMNRVPAKNRDIAMVFQSYALYPHMSVRNNLAFGLRRRSVAKDEIERRVTSVAEMLSLSELLDRKPHALSGGQRQRVALGRAIVRDPKVFLFDEPLSNLDATLRVHTRNELVRLYQRLKVTMIYVTHDQVEAMTMGTRICVMNDGKIVQVGEPLEVYRNPANTFVASFIGNPPMNLINGSLSTKGRQTIVSCAGASLAVPGYASSDLEALEDGKVIVGFRPEDIYISLPPGAAKKQFARIQTKTVAAEPLGAETLLVVSLNATGEEIIARADRDTRVEYDKPMPLNIDLANVHLFDPVTTMALPKSGKGADPAARKKPASRKTKKTKARK